MPRSLFVGLGAARARLRRWSGSSGSRRSRSPDGAPRSATDWLRAPLVGIVEAFDGHLPGFLVDCLRVVIGLTGAGILIAAATTSISGIGRVVFSLGAAPDAAARVRDVRPPQHASAGGDPRRGRRLVRLVIAAAPSATRPSSSASSTASACLITFAVAQAAVVRLRFTEPDLERPFRVPGNVRIRGRAVPVAALLGIPLTVALWVVVVRDARRGADRRAGLARARRRRSMSSPVSAAARG